MAVRYPLPSVPLSWLRRRQGHGRLLLAAFRLTLLSAAETGERPSTTCCLSSYSPVCGGDRGTDGCFRLPASQLDVTHF